MSNGGGCCPWCYSDRGAGGLFSSLSPSAAEPGSRSDKLAEPRVEVRPYLLWLCVFVGGNDTLAISWLYAAFGDKPLGSWTFLLNCIGASDHLLWKKEIGIHLIIFYFCCCNVNLIVSLYA